MEIADEFFKYFLKYVINRFEKFMLWAASGLKEMQSNRFAAYLNYLTILDMWKKVVNFN